MSDEDGTNKKDLSRRINAKAWDTEIEHLLIQQVEQYPALWKRRSSDSRHGPGTTPLWKQIHTVIPTHVPVTWNEIRQKWRNLVTSYSSILRRKFSRPAHVVKNTSIAWVHWDAMQFYHQHKGNRNNNRNRSSPSTNGPTVKIEFADINDEAFFDEDEELLDSTRCDLVTTPDDTSDTSSTAASAPATPRLTTTTNNHKAHRKRRLVGFDADRSRASAALQSIADNMKGASAAPKDEIAEFGEFIVASMRQLPERCRKKTRLAIIQLISSANSQAVS